MQVIGGFIIPVHDDSVKKKNFGETLLPRNVRKDLIKLEADKSDWINYYFDIIDNEENLGVESGKVKIA